MSACSSCIILGLWFGQEHLIILVFLCCFILIAGELVNLNHISSVEQRADWATCALGFQLLHLAVKAQRS